jgi:adenylylsulfate kinase-like enzyme
MDEAEVNKLTRCAASLRSQELLEKSVLATGRTTLSGWVRQLLMAASAVIAHLDGDRVSSGEGRSI